MQFAVLPRIALSGEVEIFSATIPQFFQLTNHQFLLKNSFFHFNGKFTVGLVLRERFEEGHQRVSVSASRGRSINRRHVYTSRHLAPRTPRPGWCRSSSSQPWGDTEADLSGEAYNACKTLNGIISARFFISLGWQINTHGLSATMHSLKPLVPPEPAGDSK